MDGRHGQQINPFLNRLMNRRSAAFWAFQVNIVRSFCEAEKGIPVVKKLQRQCDWQAIGNNYAQSIYPF